MSADARDQADVLDETSADAGDGVPEVPAPPVADADAPDAGAVEPAGAEPAGDDAATTPEPEPDYKDQWLRAAAELDNVRKRARRDVAIADGRGVSRLARELLPALDNLDRALASAESQPENADHHLTDGIRLVQREMAGALERVGIVQDLPHGEPFDPHRHEAVAQQPADGVESGTIVEVYQPGYHLGDDVLRAAKVVVAG